MRLNLLIVDDDEMACLGLENRLKDMCPAHELVIACAYSAEDALRHAQQHDVDILLTDIQMTGLNGLDLIAEMVKVHPDLCSVIITAYPTFPYAHQAIQLGVLGFLLKPVSRDEMRETLEKAIARVEARMPAAQQEHSEMDGCADPVVWAKNYIKEHLSDEINMALIANQLNLSYTYFSKLFKKETGQTFTQYITDVKMKMAARMLLEGKRTSEIAEGLGYLLPQNFNRAFFNYWHCTPGEYRKMRNHAGKRRE